MSNHIMQSVHSLSVIGNQSFGSLSFILYSVLDFVCWNAEYENNITLTFRETRNVDYGGN